MDPLCSAPYVHVIPALLYPRFDLINAQLLQKLPHLLNFKPMNSPIEIKLNTQVFAGLALKLQTWSKAVVTNFFRSQPFHCRQFQHYRIVISLISSMKKVWKCRRNWGVLTNTVKGRQNSWNIYVIKAKSTYWKLKHIYG